MVLLIHLWYFPYKVFSIHSGLGLGLGLVWYFFYLVISYKSPSEIFYLVNQFFTFLIILISILNMDGWNKSLDARKKLWNQHRQSNSCMICKQKPSLSHTYHLVSNCNAVVEVKSIIYLLCNTCEGYMHVHCFQMHLSLSNTQVATDVDEIRIRNTFTCFSCRQCKS